MVGKKILIGITVVLLVAILAVGSFQGYFALGSGQETIKVGFVAALTGPVAAHGNDLLRSAQIGIDEINENGGINGRMLELVVEDSGSESKKAVSSINKLVNVDGIKIILGGSSSGDVLAMAPVVEEAKAVLLASQSTNPAITNAGDFVFRNCPSDKFGQKQLAETAFNEFGYRRIALVVESRDYPQGLKKLFSEEFALVGGTITAVEDYGPETRDFKSILLKVSESKPDAIALFVKEPGKGGRAIRQFRELGIDLPVISNEALGSYEVIRETGNAVEGIVFMQAKLDEENPKFREFMEEFEQRHGQKPGMVFYNAAAYDAVHIIAEAIEAVGPNPEKVKDYLYTIKEREGTSTTLTIDENGDAVVEFELMTIRDGEIVPLE